ncbi:hypothetical protein GCM10010915_07440 [Microbacterium faecale]|uniref:DUF1593 domain-containing protein n=1 Tax=Microbacterium faecale TaxID=1804630 RepID=A0A916Y408_9MICO|nr:DUF1593 domain-containing protein [Microbacterium faecale]GGD29739.1 hypothetical protein GCM10010915_07440 [Microbacterium faecale]
MIEPDPLATPRIVVTTDPELDDLNSMLRLLLYSNEIDIAALVYSASQFHYAGDSVKDIAPYRWPAPGDRMHIDIAVDAYEKAYDNLVRHDPRYPLPADLRRLVKVGNVKNVGDTDEPTPGSDLVRDVLLGDAPGQVFAQAWGGMNTIARALLSIEEEFFGTERWDEIYALITRRTVITAFAEQDGTFAEYIRPRWPDLEFRDVATTAWGYFASAVVPEEDAVYLSPNWMRENVTSVGPIGEEYRVWGDGKHMADGFDEGDYFGLVDPRKEDLEAQGYVVWCPIQPAGSWISEGDSSAFALHIDNGLRNWEHPSFGGWGGRQERDAHDPHRWHSVGDSGQGLAGPITDRGEVGQWFGAYQRDFAARLRWSVTPEYADANHAPRVDADGPEHRVVSAGERVELAFTVMDPDGDEVRIRTYVDENASTSRAHIELAESAVLVAIADDAPTGSVTHVIVEATDSGEPMMTGYARFVLSVE